jgi:uncharacterized phage protein gp47/JayE
MSNNAPYPVDYTSRDYDSLRADLIQLVRTRTGVDWQGDDPSDIGVALVEAFAYMGDVSNYYLDRVANEAFIDTATQRETLLNLARLFGYRPSGPTPADLPVTFTNTGSTAIDLPIGTQVVAPLQYGDYSEVYFETTQAVTQLAAGSSVIVGAKEGRTANTDRADMIDPATNTALPVVLGASTGAQNINLVLPDTGVVDGTVQVYVGQGVAFTTWTYVDSLLEWGPVDQVYTVELNADGTTSIVFGDGYNGAIPAPQQLISASYRISSGAAGNIRAGQITEVTFIPGNINLNARTALVVTNSSAGVGGANADNNTQTRAKLKKAISARKRAVTLWDYEALGILVPGVGRTKALANTYSSVTLYIQPSNDYTTSPGLDSNGDPTASMLALEAAVSDYLSDKVPANTTLTVLPPVYADLDISLIIGVADAYRKDDVKKAITKNLLDPNTGLFSYNNYGFGDTVAFSDIVTAASLVNGVVSVTVTTLARHDATGAANVVMTPDEIPRLLASNLEINAVGGL